MTADTDNSGNSSDDMSEYLQTFLDETEEQLDDLVETMLSLERDSTNADNLNEAFRLVHSIKGSAGMMGFDNITVLTHHLENRFERFRSGTDQLDEQTMNLVLRCIDFLRQCVNRLRDGESLGSPTELLNELKRMEEQPVDDGSDGTDVLNSDGQLAGDAVHQEPPEPIATHGDGDGVRKTIVRFRDGLPLADLKAQLIAARLSELGNVKSTQPAIDQLGETDQIETFVIWMETSANVEQLREAADVEGVEAIEFAGESVETLSLPAATKSTHQVDAELVSSENEVEDEISATIESFDEAAQLTEAVTPATVGEGTQGEETQRDDVRPHPSTQPETSLTSGAQPQAGPSEASSTEKSTKKVADTMRVDIDRLDNLMNLVGELVVSRARFAQISGQINPALRRTNMLNRNREFSDGLRRTIDGIENPESANIDWPAQIQQLRAGLEMMEEQSEIWDNGRQCLNQMSEAIDQLSRVSNNLQRGVLDTRMVPVAPLFNRFKRVIRDLSKERGKKVNLMVRGENTELDKRMIDELGDPLVHLVRNSIDHGLEPPDLRTSRGKSETGTIFLEASHSGNNVHIHVRDDGRGIDVDRIKTKLIDKQLLSASVANELSDQQAVDYIWHPGFTTAKEITDVSGRGVGMDAVKTRIHQLNGTVEVNSKRFQGTTFTIRLPLTLAIINSLLVRWRNVVFSIPIDDVREIVSISERDIVSVHNKRTIEVRDKIVLLVSIEEVFQWHCVDFGYDRNGACRDTESNSKSTDVVILHAAGQTIGLQVDELLGSQDVVFKSLADNFISIRGLSGASILGDGGVCLMLDVGTVIGLASGSTRSVSREEAAT